MPRLFAENHPMARLCPTLPPRAAMNAGDHAELDLLATLERGLSDAYTLFHSVDWSRGAGALEQHGEIDIVVVNQRGDVLLMEVKSGDVDFLPGGIFKTYGGKSKDITAQIGLQYGALRTRLTDAGLAVHVSHLLVSAPSQGEDRDGPVASRTDRRQRRHRRHRFTNHPIARPRSRRRRHT